MSVTSLCLKKGSKKILAIEITKIVHISVSSCRGENPFQPDLTAWHPLYLFVVITLQKQPKH